VGDQEKAESVMDSMLNEFSTYNCE
jgi:hypothetical protein